MKALAPLAVLISALLLQGCIAAAVVGTAAVGTKTATDARTVGTQVAAGPLELRVHSALNKDEQLMKEARISVMAYQGKVLLMGQAPAILISGLGAMAAVLMLVFKDPILGLVAGIQLSANDMLRLGDWLEMPKYGADGAVTDIGLTTVKVQNWDNTITTIPTWSLVSDSFKNWSGMSASGGRRIKRSISIDTTSIHFLGEEEQQRLIQAKLLKPYLDSRSEEISKWNEEHSSGDSVLNSRKMTNIGTFRAYLNEYLINHSRIRKDMTLMVRQLAPDTNGLPIEIYCFTNTVAWLEYEAIQADIFDHIFAVVEEFGLRIHQTPTGNDIRALEGAFRQQ